MKYQVTGNEYISLPTINEDNGAVEGISFLYMQYKGMLEMYGDPGLISPYLSVDGIRQYPELRWQREHYWVPTSAGTTVDISFSCTYLAPLEEKGFIIHIEACNRSERKQFVRIGADGSWNRTLHTVNESIELEEGKKVKLSGWNHMFVFSQNPGVPLFAFAPIIEDHQPFCDLDQDAVWEQDGFSYDIHKECYLSPSETVCLDLYFGIGFEEVSASTSAKDMMRQGYRTLLEKTGQWLEMREKHSDDPAIQEKMNTNLFFSFFFASGRTIDTEELCMMTSRSPRYYVSAAYWDRDSLLWAFPAICETDIIYARELLVSVFKRQGRNFGIHSRYIDGTILEPGFELDELCAPIIALERYIRVSNDRSVLRETSIMDGVTHILRDLKRRKSHDYELYETFLQPSDDMHHYPYLTYDNVLVWFALKFLSDVMDEKDLRKQAELCRDAIFEHCVWSYDGKKIFGWSQDAKGHWDLYDEPPGSLQLLPFYGFCDYQNEIWRNTVSVIRSSGYRLSFAGSRIAEPGCEHAEHPWVLSICNSLLSGHIDTALTHLKTAAMDNGIACESVHEETGCCCTGEAFATCAGFLAFSISEALRMKNDSEHTF